MQQGFLLTRHSRDIGNQTEITLWLATPEGPVQLNIQGERPLLFVDQVDLPRVQVALTELAGQYELRTLNLKSFQHRPVAALYLPTLRSFHHAVDCLNRHQITLLEHDFRLDDRYLMERWIRGGIRFQGERQVKKDHVQLNNPQLRAAEVTPQLKVISLDLECSEQGELYSIAFYGESVARVLMIGDASLWQTPPTDSLAPDQELIWVTDELDLLLALQNSMAEFDPDILIGWNVVNFDFRLLIERAQRYGLRLKLGRGGGYASWRASREENNTGFISLPGRVVVDGIAALKTATYQFASFSLEFVAQTLLNRGKLTESAENRLAAITYDFQHRKHTLAAYNLEDCRLVWDIFQKTKLLEFLVLRSQLTGLELDRSGGSVAAFTNLYLPKLHRAGYIAPNLPEGGGLASPGGYVMDSVPGLYDNVIVLDFKSLYPAIIRTFKIDPMGLIEGALQPEQAIPGYKGAFFSRDKHFLPDIITALWQQRDEAKKAKDLVRSQALKILMNSFYGVLGSGGCRFYDTKLASSITLRGHHILKQTTEWLEAKGLKVIYGDTDSLFVLLNDKLNHQEADQIGRTLVEEINACWADQLKTQYGLASYLELEYETHYSRFFMPTIRGSETGSKKRYAGLIVQQGQEQLVFKGLESIRSDWTDLAKTLQQALYLQIFHNENPSALILNTLAELRAGQRDHQLVYSKRLRRPLSAYVKNSPPHVRAARRADDINLKKGKRLQYQHKGQVAYLMTINGPEVVEYHSSPIDYEHYVEKQIIPIVDAILPLMGLSFRAITDHQIALF
ncbi:DNA polymerase-2 [Oceanospirillum multiglobuliferum]|uniref:DNA polymerase n=1 Tax=Oceanospirillum multiglobuliferum TaxID=64969 RepID=A0A1T4MN20_9GAMM|nr:DNA polymerase II [Oceanospirillum multiglobuliferum]OPX56956.1 DNA polymerase II [Oceanospirillum multiglobuliferum]SJZ68459.1 DNA polymerase-2 [Oceanospirillum multiglobuliferum]